MAKVEIYFKGYCPYCQKAKALLDSKDITYDLYEVTTDTAKQEEMYKRNPNGRTVPQIYIDDKNIGGCDELHALDASGELDKMLS